MIGTVAAFVAGLVGAPFLTTLLYRTLPPGPTWVALAVTGVVVLFAVRRGGLLRWAAIGYVVGVLGFHAVVAWLIEGARVLDGT